MTIQNSSVMPIRPFRGLGTNSLLPTPNGQELASRNSIAAGEFNEWHLRTESPADGRDLPGIVSRDVSFRARMRQTVRCAGWVSRYRRECGLIRAPGNG
jgi:hypothetical protein